MTTTELKLTKGETYDLDNMRFLGWSEGDGTGHEGYAFADYFSGGEYLGPDQHGIEPMCEMCEMTAQPISIAVNGVWAGSGKLRDGVKAPDPAAIRKLQEGYEEETVAEQRQRAESAVSPVSKYLTAFLLVLSFCASVSAATEAYTTRLYDKYGTYQGRLVVRKGETKFYGASGTYQGRASLSGGTTKFYDKSGTLKGSAKSR